MTPSWPSRKAWAMARGTSASASTTLARFSSTLARISCSRATASARRFSALAWATCRSAAAWSACRLAPMFSPDVDLGHVDRDDLERRLRVERIVEHGLRDHVGVGQHVGMVLGRADGLDDALADAGDDRLLGGPADQAVELGPHRDAGPGLSWMPLRHTPSSVARPLVGSGQSMTLGLTLVRTASRRRGRPGRWRRPCARADPCRPCGRRSPRRPPCARCRATGMRLHFLRRDLDARPCTRAIFCRTIMA